MSLLEDIFLQDEANEAQELERIIEGDEFEGRPPSDSDDNSEKEDEAEEDKRKVDPASTKTRRVIKNPRFILNPARLTGPRGIQVIPDHFKDFKFRGKGHEREDLDLVLKKLEHWAYRLYPKFQFEDCLKKIETLGKKRPVMVHLTKIRTDQYLSEETVVQKDSSDEEPPPQDEFDKLLQQQIELARSTPAPNSAKKGFDSVIENRPLSMPKATSSPSISEEQKQRMIRNRKLAEERRLARLKNMSNSNLNVSQSINNTQTVQEENNDKNYDNAHINSNNSEIVTKRHNKSNVIESSDEEDITKVNESIRADINIQSENSKENEITNNYVDNEELVTNRHNKSNVIESSDEDEIIAVNESITADIHVRNGNKNKENSKENEKPYNDVELNGDVEDDIKIVGAKEKSSEKANIDTSFDKIANKSLHCGTEIIDVDEVETENVKEASNEIHTKIDIIENTIFDKIAKEDLNDNMQIDNQRINDIDNNEVESVNQVNNESTNIENIKNNIQKSSKNVDSMEATNLNNKKIDEIQNENLDDLMDVDFGDDF